MRNIKLYITISTVFILQSIQSQEIQKFITNKNVSDTYEVKAVKVPDNLTFAGEYVPLEKQDVKERMDRELLVNTYWQSNGLLLIKRANKFFPIIEPLLKKHGLPDDFKYLMVAESAMINVPSTRGAAGFWHFMRQTAKKDYKMEVNNNVDERLNIEIATKAASQYLKKAKKKFGSWALAAAAYNAGNGKIAQRLEEQKVSNYFDLYLNVETGRYLFRILAIKEIMQNPKKYGFLFDKEDLYKPIKTFNVIVKKEIKNIADFAKKYGVTYKDLKLVNPWLLENHLTNKSGKRYIIKIPTKK